MSRRIAKILYWCIIANLGFATVLLLAGDIKNAMLGLAGSAAFGLALLLGERPC